MGWQGEGEGGDAEGDGLGGGGGEAVAAGGAGGVSAPEGFGLFEVDAVGGVEQAQGQDVTGTDRGGSGQHWGTCTAKPPWAVSLYLLCISRPV